METIHFEVDGLKSIPLFALKELLFASLVMQLSRRDKITQFQNRLAQQKVYAKVRPYSDIAMRTSYVVREMPAKKKLNPFSDVEMIK
jgi:hypothetical protein